MLGTTQMAEIKTVVLVHGGFADGSCYAKVIPLLTARGLKAIAVQNPMSSLAERRVSTSLRHSFKGFSEYLRLSLMVC
jgi:alpha-beta hydrolase superfamily lysophospholipase